MKLLAVSSVAVCLLAPSVRAEAFLRGTSVVSHEAEGHQDEVQLVSHEGEGHEDEVQLVSHEGEGHEDEVQLVSHEAEGHQDEVQLVSHEGEGRVGSADQDKVQPVTQVPWTIEDSGRRLEGTSSSPIFVGKATLTASRPSGKKTEIENLSRSGKADESEAHVVKPTGEHSFSPISQKPTVVKMEEVETTKEGKHDFHPGQFSRISQEVDENHSGQFSPISQKPTVVKMEEVETTKEGNHHFHPGHFSPHEQMVDGKKEEVDENHSGQFSPISLKPTMVEAKEKRNMGEGKDNEVQQVVQVPWNGSS